MRPEAPPEVLHAAHALRYREHIGVNLLVEGCPFPDNWIYVHSSEVAVARIANYRNFSPAMAGSDNLSPLTVEYFASPGDALSSASDTSLIARAVGELRRIGLHRARSAAQWLCGQERKGLPTNAGRPSASRGKNQGVARQFENLLPIGRAGMFKYNNQDHAMATGLLAARTGLGLARYDPWAVNIDAEYAEAARVT